jgi:hypothetical protein
MSEETAFNPATYEKELAGGYNFEGCEVYPLQLKGAPGHFKLGQMPEEEAKDYFPEHYALSNVFDAGH